MMTIELVHEIVARWDREGVWRTRAQCARAVERGEATVETFFPARGDGEAVARAVAFCQCCPVRRPCLEYALHTHEQQGVWGGMPTRARKLLARERRKESA